MEKVAQASQSRWAPLQLDIFFPSVLHKRDDNVLANNGRGVNAEMLAPA
jgi:hypothetical protein